MENAALKEVACPDRPKGERGPGWSPTLDVQGQHLPVPLGMSTFQGAQVTLRIFER